MSTSNTKKVKRLEDRRTAIEITPFNDHDSIVFRLEELEKRLEMQRVPLGTPDTASEVGCYQDACEQVCEWYCDDYTGCITDCVCNFENCLDKCATDCLLLCHQECLADCGFCGADW